MSDEITIKPHSENAAPPTQPAIASATTTEEPSNDLTPYVILCATGLLASFFLPWVTILFGRPSGFDLQQLGDMHRLYWAIPALSAVAILAALTKRSQRVAAQIAGLVPYAILFFWLLKAGEGATRLLQGLQYGAYVALACGLSLVIISPRLK